MVTFKNYGQNIFTSILALLNVKHTKKYSNRYYNEHPNKYNLLGISSMLSQYGIKNGGFKIENKEDIFEIELPFIAHIGNDFVSVCDVSQDKVGFLWRERKIFVNLQEFFKSWTGVILLVEYSDEAIEPDYKVHFKEELINSLIKYALYFTLLISIVVGFITNSIYDKVEAVVLLILSLAGGYISFLLVQKQLRVSSRYANKICSFLGKNDCNSILDTKAAKLWEVIGWGEIGLGYFISNILLIVFFPQLLSYLVLSNVICLMYSIWSVCYQKIIAKQWCSLCLIVQFVFLCIFFNNLLFGLIEIPVFVPTDVLMIACIYSIPILSVHVLTTKLNHTEYIENVKQELNSIKSSEDVFSVLIKKQPYFETIKTDSKILFGSVNPKTLVTVLTNPHCNPCSKMHMELESFLQDTNKDICVQYIFSSFDETLDYVNKFLVAIYFRYDIEKTKHIYHEWFAGGRFLGVRFFDKLDVNINDNGVEEEFLKHELWKERTKLKETPVILINGYMLPDNYNIEDLRYVL